MNETKIRLTVDRAIVLQRDIALLETQLNQCKKDLVTEAAGRKEEHTKTEGGGSSWEASGSDGCLGRVTFPADKLKSEIDETTKGGQKLFAVVGKLKSVLFTPHVVWKPVQDFREKVKAAFEREPKIGRAIIRACESDSTPRVSFEAKETIQQKEAA